MPAQSQAGMAPWQWITQRCLPPSSCSSPEGCPLAPHVVTNGMSSMVELGWYQSHSRGGRVGRGLGEVVARDKHICRAQRGHKVQHPL